MQKLDSDNFEYIKVFEKTFQSLKNKAISGINIVEKAFYYAEEKHFGQFRKSGLPYIAHPVEVMAILENMDFSPDVLAAALLHDVVEDSGVSVKELEEAFNPVVAKIVDAVTEIRPTEFIENMQAEIKTYQKLVSMGKINLFAFYIKFADRLHNLQTLGVFPRYKQVEKIKQTERFLVPLLKILKAKDFYSAISNQAFKVLSEKDQLEHFEKLYNHNLKVNQAFNKKMLAKLTFSINTFLTQNKINNTLKEIKIYPLSLLEIKERLETLMEVRNLKNIKQSHFPLVPNFKLFFIFSNPNVTPLVLNLLENKLFTQVLTLQNLEIDNFNQKEYFILKNSSRTLFECFFFCQKTFTIYRNGSTDGSIVDIIEEDFEEEIIGDFITVKTRSNEVLLLPQGSTVLDFAFKIHNDFGFSCKYAHLNDSPGKSPIFTKLANGDKVNLIIEEDEKGGTKNISRLKWLTYVNNEKSKKQLLKYFENLYE